MYGLERLEFEIRNREVVIPEAHWVYVWQLTNAVQSTEKNLVSKVGATWLHPAARAEKHLAEVECGDVRVTAFRVPTNLDRQKAKQALIELLKCRGRLIEGFEYGGEVTQSSEYVEWASAMYESLCF